MMRIDSHAHGIAASLQENPADYLARLQAQGVEAAVLIEYPETVFESVKKMGSFVIPVPIIDMNNDGPDEVHRLFDRGARGIKFFLPRHPLGDERYFPLYQAVKEREGVAVFHTGYIMHDEDYSPRYQVKLDDLRCSHIDTIERWVPHLRVLMSHFGNPYWDECWKVMWAHPTVYADLSGGTAIVRSMLFWREMFAPNGQLLEEVMTKLCFGTDLSYFDADYDYARYIDFHEWLFDEVGAPPALREKINSGNTLSLFGLN
jgi:predicted TIM-barrel fold metal-dependent hydrolase